MQLKAILFGAAFSMMAHAFAADVRVGIIGLDTSHAVAFTEALNAADPAPEYAGFRVTAAYPKGSADIVSSTNRVPGYVEKVRALGVRIVDSIDDVYHARRGRITTV